MASEVGPHRPPEPRPDGVRHFVFVQPWQNLLPRGRGCGLSETNWGLACTATGASEDTNTTAVYTGFLLRKKERLQNGTDEVVCFKIHTWWTVGQFY
jgi:hypothetical protein